MELTERMRLGMLPSRAMTSRREMASLLPTMSETLDGRYFSTQGTSYGFEEEEEEEEAMDFGGLAGKRRDERNRGREPKTLILVERASTRRKPNPFPQTRGPTSSGPGFVTSAIASLCASLILINIYIWIYNIIY